MGLQEVVVTAGKKRDSKKENKFVSTEKKSTVLQTYLWAQMMLVIVVWAPRVSFQLGCVTFEVCAAGVVGGWIEEWGKWHCGSLVMGTISQSGVTLFFGQHT